MSRIRALARESLIYGLSSLVSRFLNFLLVPFYTHVLTPSDFGVANILFALLAFFNVLYQAGFDSAYLRLAHDRDEPRRRRLYTTAFLGQVGMVTLLTFPFLASAPWLGEWFVIPENYRPLFRLAAGILIFDTLMVVPMAHFRLRHRALVFAGIRMLAVALNIGGNLFFVWHKNMGLEGVFLANLIASGCAFLAVTPSLLTEWKKGWDSGAWGELLRYGLPLIPAGLYGIVNEMAGRLFLGRLSPADVERLYPGRGFDALHITGLFSAAWKLGVFGLLLVQMYRMAWQPFFLQHRNSEDAPQLFAKILRLWMAGVLGAGFVLSLFLDALVAQPIGGKTLIEARYWEGLSLVPIILLAYVCQAWFTHFTLGVHISKQTRILIWVNGGGALVTVLVNGLLVQRLGLWAGVWAALACYATMAAVMTWKSQKLFPLPLPWFRLSALIVWAGIAFGLGWRVQSGPEAFDWALRLGVAALGLILLGLCAASPREWKTVWKPKGV
jgi:O-antigen/teichoic acid export membrane protein